MKKYFLINIGERASQPAQNHFTMGCVRTAHTAERFVRTQTLGEAWKPALRTPRSVSHRPAKSTSTLLLVSLLTIIFTSCNDYLEETPDNRVELNTLQKASQLLTNGYSDYSYNFTEWMGDLITFTLGTRREPQHTQAYAWEDVEGFTQDTPTGYWNNTYEAIAHANEVLSVVDQLPGEEERRNAVRAEALLIRAYGHFMLVNLFAKHYDPATASQDLGIPYVEEPERVFIKQYQRNTVAEVYEKIERDMLEGIELANDAFFANSGKYHFNKNAALALASRYYLFKGDYENCIKYSSQMLGSDPGNFVKDMPALFLQRVNSEDYVRLLNSPNEEANLLLIRKVTNFHLNVGYWPSTNLYLAIYQNNPFNEDDIRIDPAYVRGEDGVSLARFEFLFERSSLTSDVGFNYTIVVALRGEEVLLNRAESYIMQNQYNEALTDLQALVSKRYGDDTEVTIEVLQNYYGSRNTEEALMNFVREERMKEFMHEGLRWFDIKRYGLEVRHVTEDGATITLEEDDPRKAIQIPDAAVNVGGLSPNPR